MTQRFNPAHPQIYFTSKFIRDHIYLRSMVQKKKAENVFLRRTVGISTVLCLTRPELVLLASEIYRRQTEFSRQPEISYTTSQAYNFWSRGGAKAKDKQRATQDNHRFRYNVRLNKEGIYAVCHFSGIA